MADGRPACRPCPAPRWRGKRPRPRRHDSRRSDCRPCPPPDPAGDVEDVRSSDASIWSRAAEGRLPFAEVDGLQAPGIATLLPETITEMGDVKKECFLQVSRGRWRRRPRGPWGRIGRDDGTGLPASAPRERPGRHDRGDGRECLPIRGPARSRPRRRHTRARGRVIQPGPGTRRAGRPRGLQRPYRPERMGRTPGRSVSEGEGRPRPRTRRRRRWRPISRPIGR